LDFHCPAALGSYLLQSDLGFPFLFSIIHGDIRPAAGQRDGDGASDAPAGARNQSDSTMQINHKINSPLKGWCAGV
jgi:hypothetical protein